MKEAVGFMGCSAESRNHIEETLPQDRLVPTIPLHGFPVLPFVDTGWFA